AVAGRAERIGRRPGAHLDQRRVSPAEPAAAGPLGHRPPAWNRVPETVQQRRPRPRRIREPVDTGSEARPGGAELTDLVGLALARTPDVSERAADARLAGGRRELRRAVV